MDPRCIYIRLLDGSRSRGQERTVASSSGQYAHRHPETNKKEHEKKQRPKRENEHEYNADLIDENTVIPPLPKKGDLIPKPDINVFKEREKKNSQRIEDLINKKVSVLSSRKISGLKSSNLPERPKEKEITPSLPSMPRSAKFNSFEISWQKSRQREINWEMTSTTQFKKPKLM